MICVDASLATKWALTEPDSFLALGFYEVMKDRGEALVAPAFMPIEVTNAVWRRVVGGLITLDEAQRRIQVFLTHQVDLSTHSDLHRRALDLAAQFGRPAVYDMHYVALAEIAGCDLWTADRRLVNAVAGRLPFVRSLADFQA